ncbi:MAG: hypothetical protein VXY93_16605, partial [Pseudomonadota bacterium]|nr:hypothetical protein [Pseudomonadota bacterium]
GVFGGGGIGSFIRSIVENVIAFRLLGAGGGGAGKKNIVKNLGRKRVKTNVKVNAKTNIFSKPLRNVQKEFSKNVSKVKSTLFPTADDVFVKAATKKPGGMVNPMKVARESGLNPLKNTIKNLFNKLPGKNMLTKLLGAVGIKGGLGALLKKFGGPFGSFVIRLAMGEGLGSALLGAAGFAAGAAIGQVFIPIPVLGAFIGGILGESLLRKMFGFAKNLLGLNKNKDKD